jgi:putative transposase
MAGMVARMRLLDAVLVAATSLGVDAFDGDFQRWCKINKVPRSTAYRHKRRIQAEGVWKPRSTRPQRSPGRTPLEVEAAIVQLRRQLGRENGAENIGYRLTEIAAADGWTQRGWRVPSRATIHKVLRRHRLVTAEPKKRPKSSYRRFSYARPRDCYQIDSTVVQLAGGGKAVVFEVLDDASRVLTCSLAAEAETATAAVAAMKQAFDRFGTPGVVLCDNGVAFTSRFSKGGTSQFTRLITHSGARLIHASPYHPQTCGKVERAHRTFKAWLAEQPPFATMSELQTLCDRYQDYYNGQRRHSAVNMPPLQAWRRATDLGGPGHLPIQTEADVRVLKVNASGLIKIGPVYLTLGISYVGQLVTVLLDGDHLTVYRSNGTPIGHRHIDYHQTYRNHLIPAA